MRSYSPRPSPSCFPTQGAPCLGPPAGHGHSHCPSPLQSYDHQKCQQTQPNVPTGKGKGNPPQLRTLLKHYKLLFQRHARRNSGPGWGPRQAAAEQVKGFKRSAGGISSGSRNNDQLISEPAASLTASTNSESRQEKGKIIHISPEAEFLLSELNNTEMALL